MLLLHRYHEHLLTRGDDQFLEYHVGNTILLNHLLRQDVLVMDRQGRIVDVNPQQVVPVIERLAQRVIAIRQGGETIQSLHEDLHDPAIYEKFKGWKEHQDYFETLWMGKFKPAMRNRKFPCSHLLYNKCEQGNFYEHLISRSFGQE